MARGSADLNTSRRTNFISCRYWNVEKADLREDKGKLTHNREADGYFEAKIESNVEEGKNVVSQSFMFNNSNVTITTNDYIENLKVNAVVEMYGLLWRVNDLAKSLIRTNFQLDNEVKYKYILELRR